LAFFKPAEPSGGTMEFSFGAIDRWAWGRKFSSGVQVGGSGGLSQMLKQFADVVYRF